MRRVRLCLSVAGLFLLALAARAAAQQVTSGYPFHSINEGFYERNGVSWGMQGRGWSFNFGGGGMANPPFGRPQLGAGVNGGLALLGNPNAYFNFTAGQGATRSFVSQTPVLTTMNGQPGFFADQTVSPFVMGFVPVVGGGGPMVGGFQSMLPPQPMMWQNPSEVPPQNHRVAAMRELIQQKQPVGGNPNRPEAVTDELNAGMAPAKALEPRHPVAAAVRDEPAAGGGPLAGESSAAVSVPSVAEAKRLRAAEQKVEDPEMKAQFARGQSAEAEGKPNVARIYYQMVARHASGELKQQALDRLQELRTAKDSPGAP